MLWSFFFLRTRPPPRSTLFPSTTLFRSDEGLALPLEPIEPLDVGPHGLALAADQVIGIGAQAIHGALAAVAVGRGIRIDRKSTRLNSSHANISYAVFCLKKKKVSIDIWY